MFQRLMGEDVELGAVAQQLFLDLGQDLGQDLDLDELQKQRL